MPGLARWLTPGRSSCGSTLFISIFFIFIYLFCSSPSASSFIFLCFFFLLLLGVGCLFLAGEVDCLFWQEVGFLLGRIFFRMVVILRACVRVAVAEFLWSVTDLTKDESPHTGYTFTPWVVSFTPPSIEHQVGGTSVLRLFQRTVESHEIDSWYPDWAAWQV